MIYRSSFWTVLAVDGSMLLIQFTVFNTLFANVSDINGWTRNQMIFFLGTFTLINGIQMCLYFFGMMELPDKIRSGKLDLYIVKPVNTQFWVTFENIDLGSALTILPGVAMVVYAGAALGIQLTIVKVIGYLLLLTLMLVLLYSLMLLFRTLSFWFTRIDSLFELEGELMAFSFRVPGIVFKGLMRAAIYLILPYALLATVPTKFFTDFISGGEWLAAIIVTAAFYLVASTLWKKGLKQYSSASS
jgi:ABC-2 type transport system permease protein